MRVVCPQCNQAQDIQLSDIIGRFGICSNCRRVFRWEKCQPILITKAAAVSPAAQPPKSR